jgi:uncharacterized protein
MADATIVPFTADPPPWTARAVLRQQWQELAYFHWPYDPDIVQRLLPADVTIDTFDGQAWVGLVPFEMRNVRIGPTPPIPWLGSFFEVNVRTYVVDRHGRRAVWFFSLDVPRSAIVAVARTAFALPYCWASGDHRVEGDHHRYRLQRRRPHDTTAMADIDFTVGHPIAPDDVTPLEHFLTARWALLTQRMGRIVHGRVDHQRWPLRRIDSYRVQQTVIEAAGLPTPSGEPHTLYSPGVDVRVARFRSVPPSKET